MAMPLPPNLAARVAKGQLTPDAANSRMLANRPDWIAAHGGGPGNNSSGAQQGAVPVPSLTMPTGPGTMLPPNPGGPGGAGHGQGFDIGSAIANIKQQLQGGGPAPVNNRFLPAGPDALPFNPDNGIIAPSAKPPFPDQPNPMFRPQLSPPIASPPVLPFGGQSSSGSQDAQNGTAIAGATGASGSTKDQQKGGIASGPGIELPGIGGVMPPPSSPTISPVMPPPMPAGPSPARVPGTGLGDMRNGGIMQLPGGGMNKPMPTMKPQQRPRNRVGNMYQQLITQRMGGSSGGGGMRGGGYAY